MADPKYAPHDRIRLRAARLEEGSTDHTTHALYTQLVQHIIRNYPEFGPLRSTALRKLAESLSDILDHAELMREWGAKVGQSTTKVEPPPSTTPELAPTPGDGVSDANTSISGG